ncbi:MAG: DUF1552 domain-containing protein [Pseudobdellovibrionaceae bacterium]
MIKYDPKSRRQFLVGSGQFMLALPLLTSILPRGVMAADVVNKKFLAIRIPNGMRFMDWTPHSTAATTQLPGVRVTDLKAAYSSMGINKILDSKFVPYLDKLTFCQGLDVPISLGHNMSGMLGHFSEWDVYPTIDQIISKTPSFYGAKTPVVDSLVLANSCSFGKIGNDIVNVPAYSNAGAAFDLLFNFSKPSNLSRGSTVISRVLASYTDLKNSSKISAEDRHVLENQMALLSSVENRIRKIVPVTNAGTRFAEPVDKAEYYTQMVDLAVLALQTGVTQVVTMSIYEAPEVSPNQWHGESHNHETIPTPNMSKAVKWVADNVFLRAISKMSQITEANGKSLLDNSLIYWGNEVSAGQGHTSENMPVVLAGSAGDFIKTGRLLDYMRYSEPKIQQGNGGDYTYSGRLYNQLLVTILQSMGVTPDVYQRDGRLGYGLNTSASGERNKRYAAYLSEAHQILPLIRG